MDLLGFISLFRIYRLCGIWFLCLCASDNSEVARGTTCPSRTRIAKDFWADHAGAYDTLPDIDCVLRHPDE
jgi:hypothetical protein